MLHFFQGKANTLYVVQAERNFTQEVLEKLKWLFADAQYLGSDRVEGVFIGPRASMITPWSTNAVEITQNMAIEGISRIEEFHPKQQSEDFDAMLLEQYNGLGQEIFDVKTTPSKIIYIDDIEKYNREEGLALNQKEVQYLQQLSKKLGRKLTDSEVFGFSQVNSEHCRHKIFNGKFEIDGKQEELSLFQMIKKTSQQNPNSIISAYKDNVAFVDGPRVVQFAPQRADIASFYTEKEFDSVLSLKAETHNFPTTVEPFNGAATGSGGEIRDRLSGGKGSIPLCGTAVYMTSYSRAEKGREWEEKIEERKWLYQTPIDILIKASNGASDFGNKFGQPLIGGSVLTFETEIQGKIVGYDKVIMLAGGVGYAKKDQAKKDTPNKGDAIVVLGGDNYKIGMGGASVSSADTGAMEKAIELNAVQRSNPEMQKRVANTVRGLVESQQNPIVSIHDHGAGGHLNCLSELVEEVGGYIEMDKLPVGDPSLSAKEIIGNESQERLGLVVAKKDEDYLRKISSRERTPIFSVGEVTCDNRFVFESKKTGEKPIDLDLGDMFGSSPKTTIIDKTVEHKYEKLEYNTDKIEQYLSKILTLEAVGCKDWLTNKVDRSVGGKVAKQQCVGELQLPLSDVGVMALDYKGKDGVATSVGHSPITGMIDSQCGSRNSVGEALSNIVFAPLKEGIRSVSLSANWMWPCNTPGEDARLYKAVKACSDFAIELGINIPTGKDSLSMTQKYKDKTVIAPGTVIISASGHCSDINAVVEPILKKEKGSIYYINLSGDKFKLGGSSFAQILGQIGDQCPDVVDAKKFKNAFNTIQKAIEEKMIVAGHDVGQGGLIVTILEMCFANKNTAAKIDLSALQEKDTAKAFFNENIGVVLQAREDEALEKLFRENDVEVFKIGQVVEKEILEVKNFQQKYSLDIEKYRDIWFRTSYLLDRKQTKGDMAQQRFENYKKQPLVYRFPENFSGKMPKFEHRKIKAAVIREKGSNSEREMANAMYLAGFEVKDIHMTDLIEGRETLEDVQFIGAVGGFSNSDVLGSAKGWAGSFKYNQKAKIALENFYKREDTLSVGMCNGCQLFMELGLIEGQDAAKGKMLRNISQKHESGFTSVEIVKNNSVMLSSLEGAKLGIWISHGEGRFSLPEDETKYNIVAKYGYDKYPACPNGSDYNVAMMCDKTGRHLVSMPHIERSIYQWNWAYYPTDRDDEVTAWIEAFVNARVWLEKKNK